MREIPYWQPDLGDGAPNLHPEFSTWLTKLIRFHLDGLAQLHFRYSGVPFSPSCFTVLTISPFSTIILPTLSSLLNY